MALVYKAAWLAAGIVQISTSVLSFTTLSNTGVHHHHQRSCYHNSLHSLIPSQLPSKRSLYSHNMISARGTMMMSTAAVKRKIILEPLGAGIKRDFRRRLPHYKSDILDGINSQGLATTIFVFLISLAPAIGFGGILDVATNGAMGVIEMLTSTAFCGVVYALCSVQPIQLIGPMGPTLAFSLSLFQVAERLSLPFLPLYAWTGLWTAAILMLAAVTSASNIVTYLTSFTDEIFSVLTSTIFLLGAVKEVAHTFISPTTPATKALLALFCATATFGTSITLKSLNKTMFFTKEIRNNLSNFAPAIGVTVGSLVARAARLRYGSSIASIPALSLPTTFATTTGRSWLINLQLLPVWARWGTLAPALLASVLFFLDQNITARLVNNPRYKQTKGRNTQSLTDGMHGDMFVLSCLTAITSMFGLPWMMGATTRSAAHIRALSLLDKDGTIRGTMENRVTGVVSHALIGACVLFASPRTLLGQVPLSVMSGVFLYLGMTSLSGLGLWDRVWDLFKDPSLELNRPWSSKVPKMVTNVFTIFQMICVLAMVLVEESSFGVLLPLIIAFMPILRFALVKGGFIREEFMNTLAE